MKSISFAAALFGAAALFFVAVNANASTGTAAFVSGSYTITPNQGNSTAAVQVAGIRNTTTNATSGSLGFELWYSESPYNGGTISGFKVAASYLPIGNCVSSQLTAGASCIDISVQDTLTLPPAGTYYPVLLLVEYATTCPTDGGYCIDDFETLINVATGGPTVTISSGAGGGGGGGSGGTAGNAQIPGTVQVGAIDWTADTVTLSLAKVTNLSTNVTTGSLAIQLWFTTTPFTGGAISSGYKVASFPLPASCTTGNAQLAPGAGCTSITSGTLSVSPPPAGTYYAAVLLEEYNPATCTTNGGYCIDNGVALNGQETVPAPAAVVAPPPPAADAGDGGGGGGGGAFEPITLGVCGLATWLAIRRRALPTRQRTLTRSR